MPSKPLLEPSTTNLLSHTVINWHQQRSEQVWTVGPACEEYDQQQAKQWRYAFNPRRNRSQVTIANLQTPSVCPCATSAPTPFRTPLSARTGRPHARADLMIILEALGLLRLKMCPSRHPRANLPFCASGMLAILWLLILSNIQRMPTRPDINNLARNIGE